MPEHPLFQDRRDAGRRLASALSDRDVPAEAVVLSLPRGAVPVAREVAEGLQADFDVFVVRELPPTNGSGEVLGAIASGEIEVLLEDAIKRQGVTEEELARTAAVEWRELNRQEKAYRSDRPLPELAGRTVVLVDDGTATATVLGTAVQAVRALEPGRLLLATPSLTTAARDFMEAQVDELVFLESEPAGGGPPVEFPPMSDEEAASLLGEERPRL